MAAQVIGSHGCFDGSAWITQAKENPKTVDDFMPKRPRLIIRLKLPKTMLNNLGHDESNVTNNPTVGFATALIRQEDKGSKTLAKVKTQEPKDAAVHQGRHMPKSFDDVEEQKHDQSLEFEAPSEKSKVVNSVIKHTVGGCGTRALMPSFEQKDKGRRSLSVSETKGRESKGVVTQGQRPKRPDVDLFEADSSKKGHVNFIPRTPVVGHATCLIGREDKGRKPFGERVKIQKPEGTVKQDHEEAKTVVKEEEYSLKFEASKRKLEHRYREIEENRMRKRIRLIDFQDLPEHQVRRSTGCKKETKIRRICRR